MQYNFSQDRLEKHIMQQHSIPQNVTSFEFRLIGDMTIKQFAYLAGFAVLAFFAFVSTLHPLIKLPLAGLFGVLGVSLAFVPIEGRPLDRWIINFIKVLYTPSQYVFQKESKVPQPLAIQAAGSPTQATQSVTSEPPVFEPQNQGLPTQPIESFTHQMAPQGPIPPIDPSSSFYMPIAAVPTPASPLPPEDQTQKEDDHLQRQQKLEEENQRLKSELEVLKTFLTQKQVLPKETPTIQPEKTKTIASLAGFPQLPNLVSGIVKDANGEVLPNIIVEVKDPAGTPVRAFKTNKLGQFSASTSLANGKYTIEVEDPKDTYMFSTNAVELTGDTCAPFEIIAKDQATSEREKLHQTLFGKQTGV